MNDATIRVDAGFLLVLASLYFFGGTDAVCALVLADAVHELGHVLALLATDTQIVCFELTASGAVLRCSGYRSLSASAVGIAAGPAAGLLFGAVGFCSGNAFCRYAGAVSILASAFNLLPALPLDGGHLLELWARAHLSPPLSDRLLRVSGSLCALVILLLSARWHLIAGIVMGIYLAALVNLPQMR